MKEGGNDPPKRCATEGKPGDRSTGKYAATGVGTDGVKTADSQGTSQTSEQSSSVMASRTSDLQERALFRFDIYCTATISMRITTKPLSHHGITVETACLAAWIIEKPFKAEVSTSAEVRIPVADCIPE